MKIPYKPAKPEPPKERYSTDVVKYTMYDTVKIKDIDKLLEIALSSFNPLHYLDLAIEGVWTLDEIETIKDDEYREVSLVWKGGKVSWSNPYYKKELSRYKNLLKEYPEKLRKYEEKHQEYLKWKASQDKIDEIKTKNSLLKQMERIKKELSKFNENGD